MLDLLGRGTGGVAEIKVSIDGYEEKSPLYGFLQYRRRKVVLRYVPEGISRLVQGMRLLYLLSVGLIELHALILFFHSSNYGPIPVLLG